MTRLVAALLVVSAICVPARSEFVVSCGIPDVDNAYNRARAVFLGEVTEIIEPVSRHPRAPVSSQLFTIKFRVERAWKGVFISTFEVLHSHGEGPYGFPQVRRGEKYIVYADPLLENGAYSGKTVISGCSRTALVSESERRFVIRLEPFDRTNGIADVRILNWRYPPVILNDE